MLIRFRPAAVMTLIALTLGIVPAGADDVALARLLQGSPDRCSSRVMVRLIERADRASLDVAAWDRNPLFHYPLDEPPSAPATVPSLDGLTFAGALADGSVRDRLEQTPLTEAERAHPLAWQPLTKYLAEWDYELATPLFMAAAGVSGEKWGNDELVRPLQQIALAWPHGDELWVKVEFRPELAWLPITDEDGDGYPELYARLSPGTCAAEVLARISDDYLARALTADELDAYFYHLCSQWYQALQTYLLDAAETHPWPGPDTEPEVVTALGGTSFAAPAAVIRGVPYGEAIYNVFVFADGIAQAATAMGEGAAAAATGQGGEAQAGALPAQGQWQEELAQWGGSWQAWSDSLAEFQADVGGRLEARPAELRGFIGREGFLFFRGDLEYLLSGDLRDQPEPKNPWPAIIDFHRQLQARGIDLLLVVIPTKAEVYPEKLSEHAPADAVPYVAPYCRKLLMELAAEGVPIVDLLPAFVAERDTGDELLYMPQDTHWTNRGVRLAARIIADQVRARPWYAEMATTPGRYATRPATCTRLGDIVDMLTDAEKGGWRPMTLEALQVTDADGALYADDPASSIVMLGDSFTGVFHFEDCRHAGLSAHLARELGMPIDLIMAQGSGPRIRGQLARRGHDAIEAKRLVIWTLVSRDLYDYWAPWDLIRLP